MHANRITCTIIWSSKITVTMETSFTLQLSPVTFFFHLKQYVNYWLWSEIYLLYAVEWYMGTDKVAFGGGSMGIGPLRMTGSHVSRVTGKSPDCKYVQCKPVFPAFYFYYSSSTEYHGYLWPKVTWPPLVFPWVCACVTGSCAISSLVGSFDRKWRYETLPRSDLGVTRRGWKGCVHAQPEVAQYPP